VEPGWQNHHWRFSAPPQDKAARYRRGLPAVAIVAPLWLQETLFVSIADVL
jgi:hypothetical protein